MAEALEGLLARSLEAFRSEVAEVLLFAADGTPLRTTHGPAGQRVTMAPAEREVAEELAGLVSAEEPVVSLTPPSAAPGCAATHVREALADAGIQPGQLVLEITESQLLGDTVAAAARFDELRDLGLRIALDDFGTGYSSLSYLHWLPLDTLKVAKTFIDGLGSESREAGFVGMIVDLARTLELDVIAEGIETPEQLTAVRELGAALGQGYLLGRPAAPVAGAPAVTA